MRTLLLVLLFLNLVFFAYTRLVGEAGDAPAAADEGPAVPRLLLVGEGGRAQPRCDSVGPFTDQAAAERAAAWLLAGQHVSRLRSTEAPGPTNYWVAITTKTLQDAAKIALRLRAAGVTDVEIMPPETGATQGTVSLGIYSERARAQRRIEGLARFAVKPVIVEQPRTVTSWWLDLDRRPREAALDPGVVAKAAEEPGTLTVVACPVSAPAPGPASGPTPEAGRGNGAPPGSNAPAVPAAAAKLEGEPA
jgi:hypothetical protein